MDIKTLLKNYYSQAYKRWRINKGSGKDIVGEEYELMRKDFYISLGLQAKKEKIAGYNADLVVRNSEGRILVIEEDKAHYVDSCFLDRFIMNAARVLGHYTDLEVPEEDIPFICLSCMTKYKLFNEKFQDAKRLFSEEVQEAMDKKIRYFPMCSHSRVHKNKYFKDEEICFDFSDELIQEQIDFVSSLQETP